MEVLELYMECAITEALGPYKRYGLWLQGCDKNCEGCISVASQIKGNGYKRTVDEVVSDVIKQTEIEGVTISGGEPFLQAEALVAFLKKVKVKKNIGVVIYTGYYLTQLEELAQTELSISSVLSMTDILIDGPYVEDLNDDKSLRGSSNQTVYFLTNRYKMFSESLYGVIGRKTELNFGDKVALIGIPDKKTCALFLKVLRSKGESNSLIKGE